MHASFQTRPFRFITEEMSSGSENVRCQLICAATGAAQSPVRTVRMLTDGLSRHRLTPEMLGGPLDPTETDAHVWIAVRGASWVLRSPIALWDAVERDQPERCAELVALTPEDAARFNDFAFLQAIALDRTAVLGALARAAPDGRSRIRRAHERLQILLELVDTQYSQALEERVRHAPEEVGVAAVLEACETHPLALASYRGDSKRGLDVMYTEALYEEMNGLSALLRKRGARALRPVRVQPGAGCEAAFPELAHWMRRRGEFVEYLASQDGAC